VVVPFFMNRYQADVAVLVGIYIALALGLNIVVGLAGLLDLGYVAFFAVGAYTMGLLTAPNSALSGPMSAFGPEWAFWLALPVVLLAAAVVGILIGAPVLRLRGDYLAIVTLGFGEIARVLVESDALRSVLGGPNGIVGLPGMYLPFIGELSTPGEYYYPVLFFAGLAAFIAWRLYFGMMDKFAYRETTLLLRFPLGWAYAVGSIGAAALVLGDERGFALGRNRHRDNSFRDQPVLAQIEYALRLDRPLAEACQGDRLTAPHNQDRVLVQGRVPASHDDGLTLLQARRLGTADGQRRDVVQRGLNRQKPFLQGLAAGAFIAQSLKLFQRNHVFGGKRADRGAAQCRHMA
jgi:hypothetical protein